MSDNEGQMQSTIVDVGKLIASIAILLSSIVLYYSFPQISIVIRALAIIFSLVVSSFIFLQTIRGKILWDFLQGSRVEIKKVIWPTKQETIQTTLTVFVFVLIFLSIHSQGIFFWLLDFLLLFITTSIRS